MKTIFKSKTAAVAFITTLSGLVGTFIPAVGEWVQSNVTAILTGVGFLNVVLRLVTKDKVTIFGGDA